MTNKPTLRFLSALLAVCMLFGMWSPGLTVHAEETTTLPISYDFEADAIGSVPTVVATEGVVADTNTITVAEDPADAENQVLQLKDTAASSSALKANVSIGTWTGNVEISFRIKMGDTSNDYIINLLGTKSGAAKQGPRFLARASKLQKHNGSAFVEVKEYTADTWYTIKFAIDMENSEYDLYIDGEKINTEAEGKYGFVTEGLEDLNTIQYTTSKNYTGEMLYIDDITVTVPESTDDGSESGGESGGDTDTTPARYTFEGDTVGAAPAVFAITGDTVTVEDESATGENKVMKIADTSASALTTATVSFEPQAETVTASFRVMFGEMAQYGMILQSGTTDAVQGGYLVARNTGVLEALSSTGNVTVLESYELNKWYTVTMVADIANKTYDLFLDGEQKVDNAGLRNTTMETLDTLCFSTVVAQTGTLYIDDVDVPAPAVSEVPEVDETAPVWASSALSAGDVTAESAVITYKPAVDDESASKYQILVNGSVQGTIDFTDVEEAVFDLPGATVNSTGQGQVYLIKPKNIPEGVKLPVLIGLHGNNGSATVFRDHTGIYGKIKEVALQNGYIFAAISNGTDIWGQNNDAGVDNVKLLLDYLVANYNAQDKAALWAYSAGGVLANRMVMKYPDSVSFVVGTYPVYDLTAMYESYDACKSAWGEDAATAIAAIDPADYPSALANHKYYLTHGDADATVPLATHSQAMQDAVGSNVALEVVSGGEHNSSDERFHSATALSAFSQNPPAVTYILSGLTAETEYSVSVKATDASGNYATSNTATFTTTAAESGSEEETPVDPEVPEAPAVAFDFEEDTLDKAPKYITVTRTSDTATVKVVADPTDPDNQVMLLENPADGPAPHALVNFSEQIGEFSVAYRVMFGSDAQYGVLLQSGTDTDKQGAYFVSRDSNNATYASKVQNIDGSDWNTLFDEVTLNAWYSVQIDANVNAKTYNISVTDANGVTKTATGTFRHASNITSLNYMSFETQGKYAGKLYVDDIAVPDPIKVEIPEIDIPEVESPEIEKYIPAYMDEQLLADGSASTYLCFPSILKLSDEKVLIVYKAGVSHANDESSMDLIVYNPTTKEVVSKTTIDGTIGENAQNPEIMQMPNGDLVIYLDIQRTSSSGQQRYGVKEVRSTDGGVTWKVLAADGTYKAVDEVEKHGYKVLTDDQNIVYGYTFDDVTVGDTVYMLAMSFPEFASDPGRSVHVIKSSDNGATWTHVKNLNVEFNLLFNESTLEAYGDGFIVNCRPDSNGTPRTYYTDGEFNVVKGYDYAGYTDLIKTTNRPKMFIENGKYYLLGRNILSGATTLCLYEIDPATMAPLNYIELKNLPGYTTGNSFYAEYYLQEENGATYFNVITYDDTRHKGHPDIVRYEYAWEELLTQTPVVPQWADSAVSVENVTMNSADVVFKAPSDDEFVTDYTITLNGETAGTIDFTEIKEVTGTLTGAKTNHSGQGAYYIAMPKNIPAGVKLPVVIAVHGSGRDAMDYRDTAFYAEQKNIALANGYIFAAISNGPDTWGLDDGLYNINLFYEFLIENYPVQEKAALWATSAGGTLANRMVKDYPEKVSFVLGTFPVYDLAGEFGLASCKSAWGTTDETVFLELIAGKNPAEFPEALKNHDYYIAHGDADTAVPIATNSQKMVTDVGSNVHLEVIEGGVHGTSNYAFYGDIIDQAFAEHPAVYAYVLTGLTADTDYTVSVTASDADGYAVVSNTASFKTLTEGEAPENPEDPEDPEDPEESTNVTYTFEEEAHLEAFILADTTATSPITVEVDPANAENHAMKIVKAAKEVDATANKANVYFEKQTETVTVSARVRFGAASRFVINLYSSDEILGPRILMEPDGRVRYKNGGSWVDGATYTTNTWYTFKIVANVATDTYDFYLDDTLVGSGAAFENSVDNLNMLAFATFGANTAEVYVDDVNVPQPPAVLYYVPEYFVQQMLFSPADDTVDTEHKYCAFPTILKLSDEKVIIVYKRGYSHMNDESNMEAIVYNPKTETVLSRTVLDATEGENAQNPEIMQMPNGDLMIYLDVQRTTSSGRQRYGIKQFRSTDGGETWEVLKNEDGSYKDLIDDTGIEYGYTFDDVIVGNDVYMLAMTFPEFNNDQAAPGRSTHIIKSSDNGATWTHIKNLNEEFSFAFNESTLETCGDGFMIVARGDTGAKPRTYLVDMDFNMIKEQDYADFSDQLISIGRPKLFIEDGKYYLLCRNVTDGTTLVLYELDAQTLEPLSYIRLNQKGGDAGASFYAESYFQEKHGQKFLNVITYDDSRQAGKPDIVRYEYVWEEIVTQSPVEIVACTFDQNVEAPEYLVTKDCTEEAVYYKSCSCGAASRADTFTTGEVLGHDWTNNDGLCARCGKFKIERTNMRFGSDLSLLFAIRQSNVGDLTGLYAKVTKTVDGADSEVVTIPSADWTTATIGSVKYYVVEFDGFAAKEMTDEVTVEIMDADGNVLNVDFATSIRSYAMEILGKTEIAGYKTAIVDMLNYGTAAQEYFDNYNIDEPANKLLSEEQKALASAEGTYVDKRVKDDTYFDASNLRFVSKINLIFRLKISEDTYAVFTWTDHNGNSKSVRVENAEYTTSEGMYVVELDELVVADARQLVTCTVYNTADDSVVTTVVDSVESNAARRTENTENLYVAFMKFADSAHAYLHSK